MKEVCFVQRYSANAQASHYVVLTAGTQDIPAAVTATRIDLGSIYRRHEEQWKCLFINWLGGLNLKNAAPEWWAYTSTAKNFLSSPLGNQVFQVLALCKIINDTDFRSLQVIGASRSQIQVVKNWLAKNEEGRGVRVTSRFIAPPSYLTLLRIGYQFFRILCVFFLRKSPAAAHPKPDICLFTYVDDMLREGNDAFFGKLSDLLVSENPATRVLHLAFIHSPYLKTLPKLEALPGYWPIYRELTLSDLGWALAKTLGALKVNGYLLESEATSLQLKWLLVAAFKWDLAKGGYFYNLLVYRAALRFAARYKPVRLFYPYENKSLEKMLLLGIKRGFDKCRILGFQHTSITPRHTTLLFASGEATCTPLPDKIITVGDITRRYLEETGNYPQGIFVTGCALRQQWKEPVARNPIGSRKIRILLALSSSRTELTESMEFFIGLSELGCEFELGVRPHPEFPLSALPPPHLKWIKQYALDFSATDLSENISWCDMTAYISSTVALESLMLGKPVINFRLQDAINPDPVLGNPAFCWRVSNQREFATVLERMRTMTEGEFSAGRNKAIDFVRDYFHPLSANCIRKFLDASSTLENRVEPKLMTTS